MTSSRSPHILILAAGKGKRMRSALPKVLHSVLGKPMLHHIICTVKKIPHRQVGVVVGHGENLVRESCSKFSELHFFVQKEQLGTGDAVKASADFFKKQDGHLLVLSGDVMLLQPETLLAFTEAHEKSGAVCSVATAVVENPTGYGRMILNGEQIIAIREEADCSSQEKQIKEVNSGIYCFEIKSLFESLNALDAKNRQAEFYLTDVPQILAKAGKKVLRYLVADSKEISGINDRKALYEVENTLRQRLIEYWWSEGVTIQDPHTTLIDTDTKLGKDVVIEAGVRLAGSTVEDGVVIESQSRIENCVIRKNAHIKQGSYIESSEVGEKSVVGPYAHLRPDSKLGYGVKIGNFVEVKKATFAENSKASHLSYIGDATIGKNVNLGCGFITCNYDGAKKHQTTIEDDVFVGSDSQTVAPVTIGKGSYIASGSTVTETVPAASLVLTRGKQITKPGYARKYKTKA